MKLKKRNVKIEEKKYEIKERRNMKLKKRNRVRGEKPLPVRKNYYPRKASPPSVMAKRSCGVMITNIQHCFAVSGGLGGQIS